MAMDEEKHPQASLPRNIPSPAGIGPQAHHFDHPEDFLIEHISKVESYCVGEGERTVILGPAHAGKTVVWHYYIGSDLKPWGQDSSKVELKKAVSGSPVNAIGHGAYPRQILRVSGNIMLIPLRLEMIAQ